MHPLTGPYQKSVRAYKLIRMLEREFSRFTAVTKREIVVDKDECIGDFFTLRSRISKAPPTEWGAIVGEIAHDLRSALDGLVWQLIILNGIDPETLRSPKPSFPIFFQATGGNESFSGRGRSLIHDRIRPEHEARIEALQPYNCPTDPSDSTLWVLHELNNADKHRLIPLVGAGTAESFSHYTFGRKPAGMSYSEVRELTRITEYILTDGSKIGEVHRSVVESGEVKFIPILNIAFGGGLPAVNGKPVLSILELMRKHVFAIVFGDFGSAFAPLPEEWSHTPHESLDSTC